MGKKQASYRQLNMFVPFLQLYLPHLSNQKADANSGVILNGRVAEC